MVSLGGVRRLRKLTSTRDMVGNKADRPKSAQGSPRTAMHGSAVSPALGRRNPSPLVRSFLAWIERIPQTIAEEVKPQDGGEEGRRQESEYMADTAEQLPTEEAAAFRARLLAALHTRDGMRSPAQKLHQFLSSMPTAQRYGALVNTDSVG
jgi:hypothetical protein